MQEEREEINSGNCPTTVEKEPEERPSRKKLKTEREFYRGVALGLLLAGIGVLASLLIRYGTIGTGKGKEGARVLTEQSTQEKLLEIRELLEREFLYDIDGPVLEEYLFIGAAAGLNDPYAAYYSADELEEINRKNEGAYFGIGATFAQDDDKSIYIAETLQDSPAMQAGIMKGDILSEVNGESIEELSFYEAIDLIVPDEQNQVTLTMLRDGKPLSFTMTFADIALAAVEHRMLEQGIGYVKIPEFDAVTVTQFREAIAALNEEGAQALVLDVRNNPGGLLTSVCQILDDLLGEGLIVSTQTREGDSEKIYSDEKKLFDGPMAVLVNKMSASASEVFAGVLQDYKMGPVIGTTTYGKGVVQKTFPLRDGSAFKFTTEKYYIAGDRDIDGKGIVPDITEEDEEKVLDQAVAYLRDGPFGSVPKVS